MPMPNRSNGPAASGPSLDTFATSSSIPGPLTPLTASSAPSAPFAELPAVVVGRVDRPSRDDPAYEQGRSWSSTRGEFNLYDLPPTPLNEVLCRLLVAQWWRQDRQSEDPVYAGAAWPQWPVPTAYHLEQLAAWGIGEEIRLLSEADQVLWTELYARIYLEAFLVALAAARKAYPEAAVSPRQQPTLAAVVRRLQAARAEDGMVVVLNGRVRCPHCSNAPETIPMPHQGDQAGPDTWFCPECPNLVRLPYDPALLASPAERGGTALFAGSGGHA